MKDQNTLISLQLPKDLIEKIKDRASKYGITMTAYIRMTLIKQFNDEEDKNFPI